MPQNQTGLDFDLQIFDLPRRCYEAVTNAHKKQFSSDKKQQLILKFDSEWTALTELTTQFAKMCVANSPDERMAYYKEWESWIRDMRKLFRESLFSNFEHPSSITFDKFSELWWREIDLLSKLSVMIDIVGEKYEWKAQTLENLNKIPEGAAELFAELNHSLEKVEKLDSSEPKAQVEVQRIFSIGKKLEDLGAIPKGTFAKAKSKLKRIDKMAQRLKEAKHHLKLKIKRYEDSKKQKKKATEISGGKTGENKENITQSREIKSRFKIEESRILFDDVDLDLPTGKTIEFAKKLIENFNKVVAYHLLDSESTKKEASDNLRKYKSVINKSLKNSKIPCHIETKARAGYILIAK